MDLSHKFVYSDKYHFIYYEIQKCFTQTMLDYFVRKPEMDYEAKRVFGAHKIAGKDRYFRFTFVRNPWARLVSCWLSKFKHYPSHPTKPGVRHRSLYREMPFEEFALFVCSVPDAKADVHFKSQHCFLPEEVIYTGFEETFLWDFDMIRDIIGLPLLPVPNSNRSGTGDWTAYYTDELAEKVGERYKEDIKQFNYSFER
jgi:hypothetical protein